MVSPAQTSLFAEVAPPPRPPVPDGAGERRAEVLARLRERGPCSLDEGDVLAVWLARAVLRGRDPVAAADALIGEFGCLPRVLGASQGELARLVGAAMASELALLQDLLLRVLEFEVRRRPLLDSYGALIEYLRAALGGQARESVHVLYLDKMGHLIADERLSEGTVDAVPIYPREVVGRALQLNASALCLAHNHPSGDVTPSRADIEATRRVVEAARPLGIAVRDHFLVGGNEVVSFLALGLM